MSLRATERSEAISSYIDKIILLPTAEYFNRRLLRRLITGSSQ